MPNTDPQRIQRDLLLTLNDVIRWDYHKQAEAEHVLSQMYDILHAYLSLRIHYNHNLLLMNLLQDKSIPLISLGEDCFPRTFLTRWGLKKNRISGEPTCPFDLAVHPLPSTLWLIKSKFADYENVDYLQRDDKNHYYMHEKLNILFNHDQSNDISPITKEQLSQKLGKRKAAFIKLLNNTKHPVFIVNHNASSPSHAHSSLLGLPAELQSAWGLKKFSIIVIASNLDVIPDTYADCRSSSNTVASINMRYIHISKPTNYSFFMPEKYLSRDGHEFEVNLMNDLKSFLFGLL